MKMDAISEAEKLWDEEKAALIIQLFEEEKRIKEIRQIVFVEWFDERPRYKLRPISYLADAVILRALKCKGDTFDEKWDDYHRLRRNLKNRRKYKERKERDEVADQKARQAALERDERVTG
jgi:hypothetical protein